MSNEEYIGVIININNIQWRVADKRKIYGKEWQYTLSHENVDGTYESMSLNENALKQILKSGSKVLDSELK
jgi:hypothetical protein